MSERGMTLRQLVDVLRGEIAWLRIYPDRQQTDQVNCMSAQAIREAVQKYGDRIVWRIFPGYGFVMVYTD
jgi:hypothetical protein